MASTKEIRAHTEQEAITDWNSISRLEMEETADNSNKKRPRKWVIVSVCCLAAIILIGALCAGFISFKEAKKEPVRHLTSFEGILLIAGGSAVPSRAEIMALNDQGLSCEQLSVPDLPVVHSDSGSFFKHRGDPVFCSGYKNSPCYIYSPSNNSWNNFKKLAVLREEPAIMELEDFLLITGGWNGTNFSSSSDSWNSSLEDFTPGPELPYPAQGHCIATLNQTHAMLIGGKNLEEGAMSHAFIFNKDAGLWTRLKPMAEKRHSAACGQAGQSKVVVAGGKTSGNLRLSSVEIFDLQTHSWSSGPRLPLDIAYATAVQFQDTFLIVGGFSSLNRALTTLYEYNAEHSKWLLRNKPLKVARFGGAAAWKLPLSYLKCANVSKEVN